MSDAESFFDTSVLLYLLSAGAEKADWAEELLECKILYSEGLQHQQVIEKRLTVINPFAKL